MKKQAWVLDGVRVEKHITFQEEEQKQLERERRDELRTKSRSCADRIELWSLGAVYRVMATIAKRNSLNGTMSFDIHAKDGEMYRCTYRLLGTMSNEEPC